MGKICLKCGSVHQFEDDSPGNTCPDCGGVYAKIEQSLRLAEQKRAPAAPRTSGASPGSRHWLLLGCCAVLAISSVTFAALYYQESRLNRLLLEQHGARQTPTIPLPAIQAAPATERKQAQLNPARPPASLANGAEVVVVSGYEADMQATYGNEVQVTIDRPGKSVLLVLSSYDKIAWSVQASEGTRITGILVSGYERPSVDTELAIPVYQSKLPYIYERDSGNFATLLRGLNELFYIQKVDVLRGQYGLPHEITIDRLDPAHDYLSLQGEQPQTPLQNMAFELSSAEFAKQPWTLSGPSESGTQPDIGSGKAIWVPQDQRI